MDKYELAYSPEDKNKLEEKFMHAFPNMKQWQINQLLNDMIDQPYYFGLENRFPNLSAQEHQLLSKLLTEKEELTMEMLSYQEMQITQKEKIASMNGKLSQINQNICKIQGHRLSTSIERTNDEECHGYITGEWYYRTCLVCGQVVYENKLSKKDVVVKMKIPEKG